jgi:hypothetical protein
VLISAYLTEAPCLANRSLFFLMLGVLLARFGIMLFKNTPEKNTAA